MYCSTPFHIFTSTKKVSWTDNASWRLQEVFENNEWDMWGEEKKTFLRLRSIIAFSFCAHRLLNLLGTHVSRFSTVVLKVEHKQYYQSTGIFTCEPGSCTHLLHPSKLAYRPTAAIPTCYTCMSNLLWTRPQAWVPKKKQSRSIKIKNYNPLRLNIVHRGPWREPWRVP